MDLVFLLELPRGLDTLPCAGDLDEDALLLDADGVVQSDELLRLLLGRLLIVGQAGVDFRRDTARDNLQDLLAKLDELWRSRYAKLATNEGGGKRTGVQKAGVTKAARRILTRRSMAAFVCSSMLPPFFLPAAIALSIRRWYVGLFAAARMSDGFVVASWGLYTSIAARWAETRQSHWLCAIPCRHRRPGERATHTQSHQSRTRRRCRSA